MMIFEFTRRSAWKYLPAVAMFAACASSQPDKPYDAAEHWSSHPEVALALSEAVVSGMRTMLQDLLISRKWFEDMDISVFEGKTEVLRMRVKDLVLQPKPSLKLVAKWQIHSTSGRHFEHIRKIVFSNFSAGVTVRNGEEAPERPDVDFLNVEIPRQTALLGVDAKSLFGRVTLVYWRDLRNKEKIVSLPIDLRPVASAYSRKSF